MGDEACGIINAASPKGGGILRCVDTALVA
jgi:hypothetical protein